jgi:GAF domain-containing protein
VPGQNWIGAPLSVSEVRAVAEEQAALRRLATLVARGIPQEEVFARLVEEVGRLFRVRYASLHRYASDAKTTTIVAIWGRDSDDPLPPLGRRTILGGRNTITTVFETHRPARIASYAGSSGALGRGGRQHGLGSGVGTPIVVEGQLWGVIGVFSNPDDPLPADTEARLSSFTELVATAVANADSRARLAQLAEEQAALRRVATLVASGASPGGVFAAVTEEAGRLVSVKHAGLARYEPDGTSTVVAWRGTGDLAPPVGSRQILGGNNVTTLVFETGQPARIDDYGDASGPVGVAARADGVGSGVGTPVIVEGRLWGILSAYSAVGQSLPADTEARLASFTELVATSIANAESRAALARLAEEQAALRRVATLVARGALPEEVFSAVVAEVGHVLGVDVASLGRYEPDGTLTFVATLGAADPFPAGSRPRLGGNNLGTIVFETGRSARMDGYGETSSGPLGAGVRKAGIRSSVATPIMVEGRLWGVIAAGSTREEPLPADAEDRLASFTDLVATAVGNVQSRAALVDSRARIVAAVDESRRRIERDLHDGAQQRLVHAVIVQKLALRALANGDAKASELLAEALQHSEQANAELQELAHGILPAALTRGGLRAGVEALVSRVSLPVSVDVPGERLPAGVEATAYFVVSEALTNVVKHARAARAQVTAVVEREELRVEVRDDGVGGARGGYGTGLGGLEDRVAAVGGRLLLESPPGAGTRVCALLPVLDAS